MHRFSKTSCAMLALVMGVVLAVMLLVYVPQARKLQRLRSQIAFRQTTLTDDSEKASVVPAMLQRVEAMKRRYKDFDRRLPKRKELGGFLREISSHLAGEGLSNQLIEPGNPSQAKLFHTLPIIMRFHGRYLDLAAFLKQLESMERLTRVQKLKVVRSKETNTLDIEMQINIYFTES